MKTIQRVGLYFIGLVLVLIIMFNVISDYKLKQDFEKKNELCIQITDELNDNINESSTCEDYYCYYARYAPPEEMQDTTETLCICDCMTVNGTIISSQILGAAPSK